MDLFVKIILALICGFFIWRTVKLLKANPELLDKQSMSKSFTTVGLLALLLIGIVAFMVVMLRGA